MDDAWRIERQSRPPRAPLRLLLGAKSGHDVDALLARIDELEARLADARPAPAGYVLFVVAPAGFSIVECDEEPPAPEQLLLLDDGAYRIVSVRRSPFPDDPRRCFVVERV
jgi:hypothetical protein